jgi:hypothetical protein
LFQFPNNEEKWLEIATDFERKWQFPHCWALLTTNTSGSFRPREVDLITITTSKHIVVLMAIANANCEFIYCDVGTNGRVSDGGVIANTKFYEKLINDDLKIPGPGCVSNSN